ncbi:MAG: ChaN family lipoprotein, partial [Aeromonas veronii]
MIRRLPLLALPLLLAACATPTQPTQSSQLQTLYDYRLSSEGDADLTLEQAIARIADADIILVGELHSHPAVHLLQSRLLSGLYTAGQQHGRPLTLSMEQFSRADQKTLDAYLANQIGEAALIREGNAWPNYPSDYRPLV